MKQIFEDVITRYGIKRGEFVTTTWPRSPWWRELLKLSVSPKAEEYINEEIEFYKLFEQELEDIPKLRNTKVTLQQWDEILHFLKIHNERLSSQIDNSTTLTATFVFMGSIFLLLANYAGKQNFIIFAFLAFASLQMFFQRLEKRHELARNKELVIIVENYLKKRRTGS